MTMFNVCERDWQRIHSAQSNGKQDLSDVPPLGWHVSLISDPARSKPDFQSGREFWATKGQCLKAGNEAAFSILTPYLSVCTQPCSTGISLSLTTQVEMQEVYHSLLLAPFRNR